MHAELDKVLQGHSAAVYCLYYEKQIKRLFSGSADQMVGAWDIENMEADPFSVRIEQAVFSIEKTADHLLVGQGAGGVHVIDERSKREIRHLKYHNRPIFQILSHPSKPYLYFLGGDGILSIVDSEAYALNWSLPISEDKLRAGLTDTSGELLFIGSSDGYLRVLDTNYYNVLNEIKAHKGGVYDMHWLSENELITVGRDGHFRLWNLNDRELTQLDSVAAHNYAIYSLDFSPSGKVFATASRDKTVKIWHKENLRNPLRIERSKGVGHSHSVNVVRWIGENKLVSAGDDRNLYVWTISDS